MVRIGGAEVDNEMLRPHTLTVLMTNTCTAKCAHCCMNSGPGRAGTLNFETIRKTIDELHAGSPLYTVVFAGGEPTLAKRTLSQAIRHCADKGLNTRLVTNASWASTDRAARRVLRRLHEDGLAELNISVDDYHLPYISFDNVVRAWKAAKEFDFGAVVIANSHGPKSRITPDFIMEQIGEEIPLRFDKNGLNCTDVEAAGGETYLAISNSKLQRLERAGRQLTEDQFDPVDNQATLNMGCPHAIQSAALSPNGHLLSCCGFELTGNPVLDFGDVNQKAADDLLRQANDDMIVNAIAILGPMFLKNFIQKVAPEIEFSENYSSVCEVCNSVVKNPNAIQILRDNMDVLGPMVISARMAANKAVHEAA